ncbi:MAG TPA: flagellin [Chloroflexota bacterium]|nr:flagellin [Chloroflexota bacterium]
MPMFINTNIMALDAQRNLNSTSTDLATQVQRLSSGLRINSAADDAAGLAISEKLETQVKGLNQAQRNAQDGISMVQTAEGAMNEVQNMLQRMRELSVQAANDTLNDSDRGAINTELQQLKTEVDAVRGRTTFNGKALLTGALSTTQNTTTSTAQAGVAVGNAAITGVDVSGAKANETYTLSNNAGVLTLTRSSDNVSQQLTPSAVAAGANQVLDFSALGVKITLSGGSAGETAANIASGLDGKTVTTNAGSSSANFQVGANASDTMTVAFSDVSINSLGLTSALSNFNSQYNTSTAVTAAQSLTSALDTAIDSLSNTRANLGASQNRLQHAINNIAVGSENMSAAQSRIQDTDMAATMAQFTRDQVLQQAGTAILAQANQVPQGVLSLLR